MKKICLLISALLFSSFSYGFEMVCETDPKDGQMAPDKFYLSQTDDDLGLMEGMTTLDGKIRKRALKGTLKIYPTEALPGSQTLYFLADLGNQTSGYDLVAYDFNKKDVFRGFVIVENNKKTSKKLVVIRCSYK